MKLPKKPDLSKRQRILSWLGIIMLLIAGIFGVMKFADIFGTEADLPDNDQSQTAPENKEEQPEEAPEEKEETKPDPEPVTNPSDPFANDPLAALHEAGHNYWVVNKRRPLVPKTYVPPNLVFPNVRLRVPGNESMKIRADVGTAVEQLFTDAKSAGHNPMFSSGYRSYNYQVTLYNSYVNSQGRTEADKQSARPGYSEHQTGMAFDICNAGNCQLAQSFGATPLGKWVAAHAHEYGFTIRYKNNMQHITGYIYEPWHLRYVGTDLAAQLHQSGKTLEEHFDLPAAPDYN